MKRLFITGASGLLGRSLVPLALETGFEVMAQYRHHHPEPQPGCRWLRGDFTTLESLRKFLTIHREELRRCSHLINGYGPIHPGATEGLRSEDYRRAFHSNVLTAVEIVDFLIREGAPLRSVANIGFEEAGTIRPYKKILPYAAAKNSLLLITLSCAKRYPDIRFNMASPPTIEGAEVSSPGSRRLSARVVARSVLGLVDSDQTGRHVLL